MTPKCPNTSGHFENVTKNISTIITNTSSTSATKQALPSSSTSIITTSKSTDTTLIPEERTESFSTVNFTLTTSFTSTFNETKEVNVTVAVTEVSVVKTSEPSITTTENSDWLFPKPLTKRGLEHYFRNIGKNEDNL